MLVDHGINEADVPATLEYLAQPRCGMAGEAVLARFAENGPPAFAVGFVSVTAGILLARHWIAHALYGSTGTTPPLDHSFNVNFFNGRTIWVEREAREACMCARDRREIWCDLWSEDLAADAIPHV
jgi:hypothetical protein